MKSRKISTLAAGGVLLLAAGLLSGCGEEPEEAVNQSEGIAIAPMPSEETVGEPGAVLEDSGDFGIEGLEGLEGMDTIDGIDTTGELEETEPLTDMFDSMSETTGDVVDGTTETVSEFAETTSDSVEDSIEITQDGIEEVQTETQTTVSSMIEETQESAKVEEEPTMVEDDAIEVVTVTPEIIRGVQQALVDAGYNPGSVDGISGPRTLAALESFQQQNNIAAGQFTKETLRALGVDY